jgi:hypothetical protein
VVESDSEDSGTEASSDDKSDDDAKTESEDEGLIGNDASVKQQLQAEVRIYEASCVAYINAASQQRTVWFQVKDKEARTNMISQDIVV